MTIASAGNMASSAVTSIICNQCRQQLHWQQLRRGLGKDVQWYREFHARAVLLDHNRPQYEPRGLGAFYGDLLSTPLPKVARAKSKPDLPEWVASRGRKDIEERARKLFGAIEGSGYERQTSDTPDATWRTVNGVPIPPRPAEPDNCCMSGCVQ